MREDICSIPINDIFSPKTGCPFCRMRDMLEDRIATYITGAAMMEPDVRTETNRLGFCSLHFQHIAARGSRLSVALILESLLQEVQGELFPKGATNAKKAVSAVHDRATGCFICENVDRHMVNLMDNTLRLWQGEGEFRALYGAQEYICLPHYGRILDTAQQKMHRKNFGPFAEETRRLSAQYLETLSQDVTHFCRMFDYRNKDADWGNSRDASERAMTYLTARRPQVHPKAEEKNR